MAKRAFDFNGQVHSDSYLNQPVIQENKQGQLTQDKFFFFLEHVGSIGTWYIQLCKMKVSHLMRLWYFSSAVN